MKSRQLFCYLWEEGKLSRLCGNVSGKLLLSLPVTARISPNVMRGDKVLFSLNCIAGIFCSGQGAGANSVVVFNAKLVFSLITEFFCECLFGYVPSLMAEAYDGANLLSVLLLDLQ
ncbi:hypothetical protein RHMOL_Rhmol10G0156700 [Rhododendron molle]|uniref:Uncharacterized protein n=1 Tax=Rhododendron molle TaxID=49168 RepID=A0ACC0M3R6_RHOML|nr:hypothetical protein RHMOL_Rhmol10G0156700 [Rhododendron molle]